MTAEVIDGRQIAQTIRDQVHEDIKSTQATNPRFQPSLVIIQVGSRPDSATYVRMKLKAAVEANIACELKNLPETVSQRELVQLIEGLNNDPSVHGVLVQLPLPAHIDESVVTNAVAADKDVDGFGAINAGELAKKNGNPLFVSCTPKGILRLLQESGVEVAGQNVVILGRSDIVGNPASYLLRNADATVTVVHSKTRNAQEIASRADILIAAMGQPGLVTADWIKPGAVVVDVGTNFVDDDSKKSGRALVGDVDFAAVSAVASKITPVPGGVGPMTVAMLLENIVASAKRALVQSRKKSVVPLPLHVEASIPSDFAISRSQAPKLVRDLAVEAGVLPTELESFGDYKAKVKLSLLDRLQHRHNGKYVLVAGITPTPLGEGKSTTTVGLSQALGAHLGKMAFANVRQPSMGPTFGVKGGAAGGGYSQVIPMDEFNMHLTGDIHAIGAANNLLAAAIDTRIFHENAQKDGPLYRRLVPAKKGVRKFSPGMLRRLAKLGIDKTNPDDLTKEEIARFARLDIDPASITWKRVLDVNDRHLRGVTVGTAPTEKGQTRETGFDITVASECMAILALSTSLSDMRERLGRMVVASSRSGEPITCDDIGAGGALTALLKDAIKPNMMQTLEGTPVFVHAGPFANISIGASSILADKMALKLAGTEPGEDADADAGYVVTEAGFDFTMGGERFFNIKCRASGLTPDVVVIVATVRALKVHGGGPEVAPGMPLAEAYLKEDVDMLRRGCCNLAKHIANARQYGVPVVVAINQFDTDTEAEHAVIREESLRAGAFDAIVSSHFAEGGRGAVPLAEGVIRASQSPDRAFKLLYETETSTSEQALETIACDMYGASGIELSELARSKMDLYTKQGFGHLPVCIAKTQYSLSHDAALKGAPSGFVVPIRDIKASVGAGYLYALAADIMTIPGLSTHSGFMDVEVNDEGEIEGLF